MYGTLRTGSGHPVSVMLDAHSERIGPASLRGALFDLGQFPGAVEQADHPDAVVHGELVRLRDASILRHLDDYEGHAFERVLREVRLWDGSGVQAWTYVYRGAIDDAVRVAGGDWLG